MSTDPAAVSPSEMSVRILDSDNMEHVVKLRHFNTTSMVIDVSGRIVEAIWPHVQVNPPSPHEAVRLILHGAHDALRIYCQLLAMVPNDDQGYELNLDIVQIEDSRIQEFDALVAACAA